jgi:dGTPase
VLAANMSASKKVSELTLLFTIYQEFIEEDFRIAHGQLSTKEYASFYRNITKTIEIPKELLAFLPLDSMIGFKDNMRKGIDVMKLILAKDYVAGLTDKKISSLHTKLVGR